jgi:hypothetical protein
MKNKKQELDVDFIGGQGPLTPEEEKTISEFIRQSRQAELKKSIRPASTKKRKTAA